MDQYFTIYMSSYKRLFPAYLGLYDLHLIHYYMKTYLALN